VSAPILKLWLKGALILKFILRDLVNQYVKIGYKGHGISTGNAEFKKPMILKIK
jgi:hypothetical protein